MRQPTRTARRARGTALAILLTALALTGCATRGRLRVEAPTPAPAVGPRNRAERPAGGITEEGLRSFLRAEARPRDVVVQRVSSALAGASTRLGPVLGDLDPITESMGRLPKGHRWFAGVLVPSQDAVDLGSLGGGTLSGRTWERDEDLHGFGLGYRAALGGRWFAAAEIGVAPFDDPADGGVTVLVGVGRKL